MSLSGPPSGDPFVSIVYTTNVAVLQSGAFTISYPAGVGPSNFLAAGVHTAFVGAVGIVTSSVIRTTRSTSGTAIIAPAGFAVVFGAANITVTWWLSTPIPAGAQIRLNLAAANAPIADPAAAAGIAQVNTGLAYLGKSPATFTVPAGALGIWSVVRTSGYSGPCLNLRRSSDNATQDIGFLGDIVDYAAADAFVGAGNTGFVTALYDQSGSGKNLTQATTAAQPVFIRSSQWNGIRPVTIQFPGNASAGPAYLENAALSYASNACTFIAVCSPRESYSTCSYWRGAQLVSTTPDTLLLATALGTLLAGSNGLSGLNTTGIVPVAGVKVAAVSYGAGATIIDFDGIQGVSGAATNHALTYASFGNGRIDTLTQTYNFHGDYFFMAIYPSAFTGPQLLTLRTTLQNAFVMPVAQTANLVYGGNSLLPAYAGANALSLNWVGGLGRALLDNGALFYPALPQFKCYQLGSGGRTMAAEYAARAVWLNFCFNAAKEKNIYIMCDASNDISLTGPWASTAAAQAAMDALYTGTFLPYLAAIKVAGYSAVIASTVISRGGNPTFQLGTGNFEDDARLHWNDLLRGATATQGFILSDRASDPAFSGTTAWNNPVYYSAVDHVHPTDAGNTIIVGYDIAAILSA